SLAKKTRSRAIAKKRRGNVSVSPLAELMIDTRMSAATALPAHGPIIRCVAAGGKHDQFPDAPWQIALRTTARRYDTVEARASPLDSTTSPPSGGNHGIRERSSSPARPEVTSGRETHTDGVAGGGAPVVGCVYRH